MIIQNEKQLDTERLLQDISYFFSKIIIACGNEEYHYVGEIKKNLLKLCEVYIINSENDYAKELFRREYREVRDCFFSYIEKQNLKYLTSGNTETLITSYELSRLNQSIKKISLNVEVSRDVYNSDFQILTEKLVLGEKIKSKDKNIVRKI